jgi:16S rRNA (guanine966-N2)-methyltransferase
MRVQLRIVSGELRNRKLTANVHPGLRPTPEVVREAFFSILGNAIPERPFFDVFAGTGILGLEALSRGASSAVFVERDFRLGQDIDGHLQTFGLGGRGKILRADSYRWAQTWAAPAEPVNVYISPPFPDLEGRPEVLLELLAALREKVADGSVIVLQSEKGSALDDAAEMADWERRKYGRNVLFIWVKEGPTPDEPADES